MFSGWKLGDSSRDTLENIFGVAHPKKIAHHITYMFGPDSVKPKDAKIYVIGHCITDKIECFVVEVDGSLVRPDGKTYHITWSLDPQKGAKPVDSNEALEKFGFVHIKEKILIQCEPKVFKF